MKKVLYVLYQPYKWLVYAPLLALITLFFGFLAVLFVLITTPRITSKICGTTWARLLAYLTPMLVQVTGREHVDKNQSYVIISNHQSQFDIILLYGWFGIDFKWVMKQELRKVPGLGIACEKVGHIYIDRSNNEKAIASLNAAKKNIVNGTSVLFFPEGTRSLDGALLPFKKGAFKMVLDLGLPILPITIDGTKDILPSNTLNLFPGKAKLAIHKPIDTSGYTDDKLQELMDKTRTVIANSLVQKKS